MDELLIKYIRGQADMQEREQVLRWIEASQANMSEYLLQRQVFESCLMAGACAPDKAVKGPQVRRKSGGVGRFLAWSLSVAAVLAAAFLLLFPSGESNDGRVSVQTVCAPLGQQTKVDLSDGTVVWLNSHSELVFTDLVGLRERRVTLRGEAYFEVARDENRPFIVQTEDFSVRVLGTKFNVNTYNDCKTVVLAEGAVNVCKGKDEYALCPSEMFFYDSKEGDRGIRKVNTDNYISWINGYLELNSTGLDLVLVQLQSYFGVSFEFDSQMAAKTSISGKLELRDGLETALKNLENSASLTYKVRDNGGIEIIIR